LTEAERPPERRLSEDDSKARAYRAARERWQRAFSRSDADPRPSPGLYAGGYDPPDLFGPDDLEDIEFDPARDLGFPA